MNDDGPRKLECLVESYGELRRITIIEYELTETEKLEGYCPFGIRIDGFIDDGVETVEEILERYGQFYWNDLKDFKANHAKGKSLKEWMGIK